MREEGEVVAAVGSRNEESAKAFAEEYGIEKHFGSYEELASSAEVEAVYVATPNNLHFENCKLCLMNGKHVLCEKPFTINPEQAAELYRLAEEKQLYFLDAFMLLADEDGYLKENYAGPDGFHLRLEGSKLIEELVRTHTVAVE
jgi:predicted dehydrogenase